MNLDLTCFNWAQLIKKTELPANAKYLGLYLSTFMNLEHNIAWPSQARISHETGLSIPTVRKWLSYLAEKEWLVIKKSLRMASTKGGEQLHNEYIISVPTEVIRGASSLPTCQKGGKTVSQRGASSLPTCQKGGKTVSQRGVNESSKGGKQLSPNNNTNNNSNKGRFTPPTVEQVKEYIKEKGYQINADDFVNHYGSVNWFRGKTKITNWKLCVGTWIKSEVKDKKQTDEYGMNI